MQLGSSASFKQQSSVWDWNVGYWQALLLVCNALYSKKYVEPGKCTEASSLEAGISFPSSQCS